MREKDTRKIILSYVQEIKDLFSWRRVSHDWQVLFEEALVEKYFSAFGIEQKFISLIKILLTSLEIQDIKTSAPYNHIIKYQSTDLPIEYLKLFHFAEKKQETLKAKVKRKAEEFKIKKTKTWIYFLQVVAGIAILKECPGIQILTFLNKQQGMRLRKILFETVVQDQQITLSYSNIDVNIVILVCIKASANRLLEFLLRIGAGNWYTEPRLLLDEDREGLQRQHPVTACLENNNVSAFQLFLTYARHLFSIKVGYNSYSVSYPPLYWAAYHRKIECIEMAVEQVPEVLDLQSSVGENIAHGLMEGNSCAGGLHYIAKILKQANPGLFSVRGGALRETPQEMLDRIPYRY